MQIAGKRALTQSNGRKLVLRCTKHCWRRLSSGGRMVYSKMIECQVEVEVQPVDDIYVWNVFIPAPGAR